MPEHVEPVVAPPPGNPRFPLVDGMRAIAALMVLVVHTSFLSGADFGAWYGKYTSRFDVGVPIFFAISGFLLYRPFVAAHLEGKAGPRVGDYAWRRFLRIVPAYWLALTVLSFYPGLREMWTGHSWAYYLFVSDYNAIWTLGGLQPAWSLGVEVAFYVALPFIGYGLRRAGSRLTRDGRVRLEFVVIAAMGVLSAVSRVFTPDSPKSQYHIMLPGTFAWFASGMLIAIASAALAGREPAAVRFIRRWPSAAWLAALALFWVASIKVGLGRGVFFDVTKMQSFAQHLLYAAIAFFLLLPAVFAGDGNGVPRRILRNRFVAWLGLISYGIFLWHHPIATKLSTAKHHTVFAGNRMLGITIATFVLSVACAAGSYYLLERPILRYKNRPFGRARRRRPVATVSAESGSAG